MEKISPGTLLDTGPLVALLDSSEENHEKVHEFFPRVGAPFRTCESVLSEACFILKRTIPDAIEELLKLGEKGLYEITFDLGKNFPQIKNLLKKYQDISISLADACLIRCAELYQEPRIFTFDSDFEVYRWGRNKRFTVLK